MSVKYMYDPTRKKPVLKKASATKRDMKELFSQRFVYASIIPTKNYSAVILAKTHGFNTFDADVDDLDDEVAISRKLKVNDDDDFKLYEVKQSVGPTKEGHLIWFDGEEKRKYKRTKYFYNDIKEGVGESVQLNYAYHKNGNVYHTTKDRHIKRLFGDPFTAMTIRMFERRILTDGNKVTIKIYKQVKERGLNMKYFKVSYDVQSLTLNLTTGNFTITHITKKGKARTQNFKCNSFYAFKEFLMAKNGIFMSDDFINTNYPLYPEFIKEFNNDEFHQAVADALQIELGDYSTNYMVFAESFAKRFVQLKKIKVPNDYVGLLLRFYPTEKYLKKNKRKLVMSVLDMFNIKSDITNKIVHMYPKAHLASLVKLCNFFGNEYPKYIGSLNGNCFKFGGGDQKTNDATALNTKSQVLSFKDSIRKYNITSTEKENIIRILNGTRRITLDPDLLYAPVLLTNDFIATLYDHFDMITKIREYDPDLKLKARNYADFNEEHVELSKLIACIRKGSVVRYTFDPAMLKEIEAPIRGSKYNAETEKFEPRVFHPILFKMEEDFIEEGKFMHHCVAGYSNREDSIIISLRLDDDDERVTSQYNTKTGQNIQSKFLCNAPPPEHFIQPLETLNAKVRALAYQDKLMYIEKENVPLVINGKEIVVKQQNVWGNVLEIENILGPF